jgi:hypothetical protein
MGAINELGLKPGVITGDDVLHVLPLCSVLSVTSSLNTLANTSSLSPPLYEIPCECIDFDRTLRPRPQSLQH